MNKDKQNQSESMKNNHSFTAEDQSNIYSPTEPEDQICKLCKDGGFTLNHCPHQDQKKDSWEEEYCDKFGLCNLEDGKCQCVKELNFISKLISKERTKVREETIEEIRQKINKFLDKEWKDCTPTEDCTGENRYCCSKGTLKTLKYEIQDILDDFKALLALSTQEDE